MSLPADLVAVVATMSPALQGLVHLLTIVSMIYGAYLVLVRKAASASPAISESDDDRAAIAQQRHDVTRASSALAPPSDGRLDALLNSGLTSATPLPRRVAVRCTNFVATALMCLTILWALISLFLWPNVTLLIPVHLLCFVAFCSSLLLSQTQRLDAARFVLLFFGFLYYCAIVVAVGPRVGVEFCLLVAACVPPLIYERAERRKIYIAYACLACAAGAVALLQHGGVLQSPISLNPTQIEAGYYLSVVATAAVICSAVPFFMWYALTNLTQLELEHQNADTLLRNLLPEQMIDRLRLGSEHMSPTPHEATVLLAYLTGLSAYANRLAPTHMVEVIDRMFGEFDAIVDELRLHKVNTFGNAYLGAVGLFDEPGQAEINAVGMAALRMVQAGDQVARDLGLDIEVRVGICTGQAIAGLIGRPRRFFGVWGETIHIARGMDADTRSSCIRVAESSYFRLQRNFHFGPAEPKTIPGVGVVNTYELIGARLPLYEMHR